MKLFNVGAMCQATDDARLSATNDLVQRTLSQHGLVPQSGQTRGMKLPNMPALDHMLARLNKPSKGAGAAQAARPAAAEFKPGTFSCQAGSRSYYTYSPASATNGATGVVMMLHGCTQTPEDFAAGTGMNTLAEQHRFIVVYPAQSRGDNMQSCWNWFSHGDQRRDKGEPAILAGIAKQVCADHSLGRNATFVAGLSAGAAMAVILGETYPDVFSGVGAHSGLARGSANDVPSAFAAMAGNPQSRQHPVHDGGAIRTIVFHGSADNTVHPANGENIVRRAMENGPAQTIGTTHRGEAAGRSFARQTFSVVAGPPILEHWTIDGLGHAWSGGHPDGSYTDPQGPDASAQMVRFFFDTTKTDL